MMYTTTLLVAATATLANAQSYNYGSGEDDYISQVCNPTNSSGYPDFNAPCNAVMALQAECLYGPEYLSTALNLYSSSLRKRQSGDDDQDTPTQSNSTQRTCICESQFWDQAAGCAACYKAHGNDELESELNKDSLASLSSSYCAASTTPTAGFADFLFDYANQLESTAADATATSFSDPIGNKTAVSYYFTPSVTGSAAWVVAEQTGSATSGASANTVSGQIVPTASANNDAAQTSGGASGSASASASGNAAAGRKEGVAAAGLIGFAGLVALL